MSEFYVYGDTLVANTVARSADLKAEFEAIEAGLDKLPTEAQLKLGTAQYGTAGGAANAYLVTLPYTPAAYVAGMVVRFKAGANNTGASTVNVNSKGVKNIVRPDGTALHADDISASGVTTLVYDGTNFVVTDTLVGVIGEAAAQVTLAAGQVTLADAARVAAEAAQSDAEDARDAAAASYDDFDDRYLGAKAANPSTDNDGGALITGALYWNTAVGEMRAWNGSAWVTAYNTVTTASQAEMEAGTEAAIRSMSPLRVAQAIAAQSSSVGKGGAVVTDGVTLTAASSAAQAVTPTYYDEVVTLPDATTMREGVPAFVIQNKSELFDLRVKDSAGTTLGWIRPLATGVLGLADNSTVAGNWIASGLEKLGVSAGLEVIGIGTGSTTVPCAVTLDASRTLLLPCATAQYAIVHDASTNTYGAATLIAAAGNYQKAVLLDTDKVLVVYVNGTNAYAVVLTISGTTITVGTPVSAAMGSTLSTAAAHNLVKVSTTSAAFTYSNSTNHLLHAIGISGTTVTWSASQTLVAHANHNYNSVLVPVSTSILVTLYISAGAIVVKPWTVSGSTLTAGTAASISASTNYYRWTVLGTGRILLLHGDSANNAQASLINISGTTATASTVTLAGTYFGLATTTTAVYHLASNKVLVAQLSSGTNSRFYTLTDTSGTLSAGTELVDNYDLLDEPFYVGRLGDVVTFANGTNIPALFNVTLTADQPTSVHHAGGFFTNATGGFTDDGYAYDTSVLNRRTKLLRAGQAVYALNTITNHTIHLRYGCGKIESVGRPDRVTGVTGRVGCPSDGRNDDFWFFSGSSATLRLHRLEAVE